MSKETLTLLKHIYQDVVHGGGAWYENYNQGNRTRIRWLHKKGYVTIVPQQENQIWLTESGKVTALHCS